MRYFLTTDANSVVNALWESDIAQPGAIEINAATYAAAVVGQCRYVSGVLQPYTPPVVSSSPSLATSVGATDLIQVLQSGNIVLATAGQVYAVPMGQCASLSAAAVALTQRVAALEGKPDPCVALSGSIPVATVQVGTVTMAVSVPGLLAGDRVAVEPAADLPAGLVLAWAHPASNGVLTVALTAGAVVAIANPVPLNVVALR